MNRYFLVSTLLSVVVCATALGQKPAPEQQMELRRMQLELEEQEAELQFQRQMRKLELEQRRIELERQGRPQGYAKWRQYHRCKGAILFVGLCLVVNILAAVWVYQDIRKQNKGSGIWIAITLLTGLFGVLVYSIVRLGENQQVET